MSVLEEDVVAASETAPDDRLVRWRAGFDEMFEVVAGEFAQAQWRWRARLSLLGLLSGAERKNSWTIAEQAGDLSPDGMQRLLNHYMWGCRCPPRSSAVLCAGSPRRSRDRGDGRR